MMPTANIDDAHDDRLFNSPSFWLSLYNRFFCAVLGSWLAMGLYTFSSFRDERFLIRQRVSLAVEVGLTFSIFVGILVLLAAEVPTQLRQRRPRKLWLIIGIICGSLWGTLTWTAYHWFSLYDTQSAWDFLLGGVGLAIGFSIVDWVSLPGWVSILLPAITTFLPIWLSARAYLFGTGDLPLVYFEQISPVFTIGIPMALLISLGGTLPVLWRRRRRGISVNTTI